MNSRLAPMPTRFEGFPGFMQGGYLAGLAAGPVPGPTRVQIHRAIRPGDQLDVKTDGGDRTVLLDGAVAMKAFADPIRVAEPELLDPTVASAAMSAPLPWPKPFPECAGCGDRADGLGLEIRPSGRRMVATWTPGAELADAGGLVRHENVWTVVDCFTSWAIFADPPADTTGSFVTGNIALELRRPVRAGTTYVMQSWRERDAPPGVFALGSVIVGGSIEDSDGIVGLADQEMVRTTGFGMTLDSV